MNVYAVFKQGKVYRQEMGGAFSSLEKAKQAAEQLIIQEDDDYHSFEIFNINIDDINMHEDKKLGYHRKIIEPESIMIISRTTTNGVVSISLSNDR